MSYHSDLFRVYRSSWKRSLCVALATKGTRRINAAETDVDRCKSSSFLQAFWLKIVTENT